MFNISGGLEIINNTLYASGYSLFNCNNINTEVSLYSKKYILTNDIAIESNDKKYINIQNINNSLNIIRQLKPLIYDKENTNTNTNTNNETCYIKDVGFFCRKTLGSANLCVTSDSETSEKERPEAP